MHADPRKNATVGCAPGDLDLFISTLGPDVEATVEISDVLMVLHLP